MTNDRPSWVVEEDWLTEEIAAKAEASAIRRRQSGYPRYAVNLRRRINSEHPPEDCFRCAGTACPLDTVNWRLCPHAE